MTNLIFETSDPDHHVVCLTNLQWTDHILKNRGNSFKKYLENIKDCIEKPDHIRRSNKKPDTSRVYIQENNTNRDFIDPYLVVFVNKQSGLVETAYTTDNIGRFPK